MYCENCRSLFEGDAPRCPLCNSKKTRLPKEDDLCKVAEEEEIWADMLSDVFTQNDIPFTTRLTSQSFVALALGPHYSIKQFLVPYSHYPRACEFVALLLGSKAAPAENAEE